MLDTRNFRSSVTVAETGSFDRGSRGRRAWPAQRRLRGQSKRNRHRRKCSAAAVVRRSVAPRVNQGWQRLVEELVSVSVVLGPARGGRLHHATEVKTDRVVA